MYQWNRGGTGTQPPPGAGRRGVTQAVLRLAGTAVVIGVLAASGCDDGRGVDRGLTDPGTPGFEAFCDLNAEFMFGLLGPDMIPSIDAPVWDRADVQGTPSYLSPADRVIGIRAGEDHYAIPHNVLWHHEIVNAELHIHTLAITYCPLTGSALVFDRGAVGGVPLGVSGNLYMDNLVMFERGSEEPSLWTQFDGVAGCGPMRGARLSQFPFVETRWDAWVRLHPETWVLADAEDQGFDPLAFDYFHYPYASYEDREGFFTGLMPPLDRRRFSKERVIGLPPAEGDPGIAFPFGVLEGREGGLQAVSFSYRGEPAVILWSDAAEGGGAYEPRTENGVTVELIARTSGFEDLGTGSTWTVDGTAVTGPLAGARLVPLERAHTAFWGSWAAFHPDTRLWEE